MLITNECILAIDRILHRAWIDEQHAFADAAQAAREDVVMHGSVPDRLMLLTQQPVVLRGVPDHRAVARRYVWISLGAPGGDWSHPRLAALALAERMKIVATLITTTRGADHARSLCIVYEQSDREALHLRASILPVELGGFVVGDFARTRHAWADGLSLRTHDRPLRRSHLRLLPGGKKG